MSGKLDKAAALDLSATLSELADALSLLDRYAKAGVGMLATIEAQRALLGRVTEHIRESVEMEGWSCCCTGRGDDGQFSGHDHHCPTALRSRRRVLLQELDTVAVTEIQPDDGLPPLGSDGMPAGGG